MSWKFWYTAIALSLLIHFMLRVVQAPPQQPIIIKQPSVTIVPPAPDRFDFVQ